MLSETAKSDTGVNQNKGHLPFLDGIRGVAILAVFLFHTVGVSFGNDKIPWKGLFPDFSHSPFFLAFYPLTYGKAGVAIFFVVSGFCIHLSHRRSSDKGWLCFFNRRFFRIYPAYLLAILLFFFIWPWGSLSIESSGRLKQLGLHMLALHNLQDWSFFGINPSFWSIAVEIQLYAIYPLLVFLTRKLGWRTTLGIAAVLEISLRSAEFFGGRFDKPLIYASPFAFWFSWSIGAYLAECFLLGRRSSLSSVRFDLVAIAAFSMPLFRLTEPYAFMGFCVLTGIAIDRLTAGDWKIPKGGPFQIVWRHLSFLGLVSYSFYLFHQPIIALTGRILASAFPGVDFSPLVKFAVCCAWYPLILLLARGIYQWVELPSISLGKNVWSYFKSVPWFDRLSRMI